MTDQRTRLVKELNWVEALLKNPMSKLARASLERRRQEIKEAIEQCQKGQ